MLSLAPAGRAHAGAWTPEPGSVYLKLWLKYLYGFDFMSGDGNTYGYGFYNEIFLNAYTEIGLADGLAFWAHFPFMQTFLLEDPRPGGGVEDRTVVGDPTLGVRVRLFRFWRFTTAIEGGVRLPFAPSGDQQALFATAEGNPEVGQLRVGTGVYDFPFQFALGFGYSSFYAQASLGYVLRTGAFDHVLTWTAEAGGTFQGGMALRGRVRGWHALGNGDPALYHQSLSGIGSGTNYVGFAVEADIPVAEDWRVGASIEGGLGALSRQTGGPVISLYVSTRLGRR